MTIKTWKF